MTTGDETAATLADELTTLQFDASPLAATLLGVPGYDDRLSDPSAEADARLRAQALDIAKRAASMTGLTGQDAVTAKVVAQQAEATVDQIDSRMTDYTVTDLFVGPAASLLAFLPMVVLPDAERAADYLARLRAIPAHLDTVAIRHRDGAAAGRVPVRRLVDNAVAHLDRYLAGESPDPLLSQALAGDDNGFAAERERVVAEVVRPAFARYRAALADDIAQHGRPDDRPGLCALPDGEAAYAALSRVHTTTDRTPDDLHQTGMDVIAGLREEYAELGERLFGTRDQAEIFQRLIDDPALRWRDGDELLDHARAAIERAEAAAPAWFGRLPGQRCQVEPVPATDAAGAPAAYYMQPSMDGLRPGVYYANTHEAQQRDRFLSEVTAFHEAVPGHHFQLTLALELTDLPLLRRIADVNAYSEGWGLYTERLADEMGLYSDDVARIGMLAMDSMRAGRLVVDTGLHAKGWSRERAVAYLRENTPLSALDIGSEVDRYIAYPGQALSYMVGRLEIQRIRREAERRLGADFDIRGFHDVVLGNGLLPLSVLDDVVRDWQG